MTKIKLYTPSQPRFSLKWWIGGGKNLFFVALVTLLVWVYADMYVADKASFQATISMNAGNSTNIELLPPREIEINFTLRGTRRALRSFQDHLDTNHSKITYNISADRPSGPNTVSAEELIGQDGALNRLKLSMVTAVPDTVAFSLDNRVSQLAQVELDYVGAILTTEPVIEPPQVTLNIAERDLLRIREQLRPDEPLTVKTKLLDLAGKPTGQSITEALALVKPRTTFDVSVAPKQVKATFEIDQRTDKKSVTVNINTIAPSAWAEPGGVWSQYELNKRAPLEWRREITVTGARQDIERLRPEHVEAYITLSEQDKAPVESWRNRTAKLRFADGMELQVVGEAPSVSFKLQKRPLPSLAPSPPVIP